MTLLRVVLEVTTGALVLCVKLSVATYIYIATTFILKDESLAGLNFVNLAN